MTCKEKIDKIEEILGDVFITNSECIERIREIVKDEEDMEIPLKKIIQARDEIRKLVELSAYTTKTQLIHINNKVLKILYDLIENEKMESERY